MSQRTLLHLKILLPYQLQKDLEKHFVCMFCTPVPSAPRKTQFVFHGCIFSSHNKIVCFFNIDIYFNDMYIKQLKYLPARKVY